MKRYLHQQRSTTRRGAVLIVVLAMLALFAVIGLSFVLYAESQANMADSNKRSYNEGQTWEQFLEVNPEQAAELYLGNLIYGVGDYNNDLMNPLRGHSLGQGKYGDWRLGAQGQPSLFPFAGQAVPAETMPFNVPGIGPMDRRNIVSYMWDNSNSFVVDPERLYNGVVVRNTIGAALPGTYVNGAVPYTYPDRQANFFLALQDQTTGEIVAPSFFRPDLFGSPQLFNSSVTQQQRLATVRPTRNFHTNFPPVPQNPDGTFTGDVQNMKFLSNSQKNDSFWMDAGGPVVTIRGRKVKAMVAPLILDLSSKVNLSIAGNMRAIDPTLVPLGARHTSHEGLGAWEINPGYAGVSNAELRALLQKRFPNDPAPLLGTRIDQTRSPTYARNNLFGTLNDGQLPPLHAGFSPEGVTTSAVADPMILPTAASASTFPNFPNTRFPNSGSLTPVTLAERLTSHPHLYNPLLYRRGSNAIPTPPPSDRPFGLNDVVTHSARVNDGKNRWASTEIATGAPTSFNNREARLMTTGFSAVQQLPMLPIRTGPGATDYANLGPIDINRTLPDYRKNTAFPLSPLNMWNPTIAGELQNFLNARQARQTLARDIFIRLAVFATFNGGLPAVDGTNVFYDVATGYLNTSAINILAMSAPQTNQMNALRSMAQLAANMVDFIDHDDIATAFVWNPNTSAASWVPMTNGVQQMDPSGEPLNFATTDIAYRAVYGTELPKLVLNEVYSAVANQRDDPFAPMMRAQRNLKRRYYIELHNPMPLDATRPDSGATRLKYQGGTSQVNDATGAPVLYSGPTFSPYMIEIATGAPFVAGTPQVPFSFAMSQNPLTAVVDHAMFPVAGMTLQARITSFTHDATAPAPVTTLAGDGFNLVQPFNGIPTQGSNNGFYVMGPRDPFTPATQHSISLPDPAAPGVPAPAAPVDVLTFDATNAAPSGMDVTTEAAKTSVIMLRRLMNPYIGYDPTNNPYITVDYLENIPTRDRATNDSNGVHTPAPGQSTAGSQGRVHPYVAFPTYGTNPLPAISGVNDHIVNIPMQPSNSMFGHNEFAQNNRTDGTTTKGFEWMVHFDRKLINSMELLHVGTQPAALVTQRFAVGNPDPTTVAAYPFLYQYHTRANNVATTTLPYLLDPINAPNYYKLLDFLTCGSTLPGTPIGWREPGKMNPNGFTRLEPFLAVTDPQQGNRFIGTDSTNTWSVLSASRTPTYPVVGPTTDETGVATNDRPLKALSSSANYDETLLRGVPGSMPYPIPGQLMSVAPATFANSHPYTQYEQLRKSWNNLTPVSDSFLVIMTVSYFEVDNDVAYSVTNPPQIGKEVFNVTPGDLRSQFAGVVDRSNLAVPMNAAGVMNYGGTITNAEPWAVKLVEDVHPGATTISVEAAHPGTLLPVVINPNQMGVNISGYMTVKPNMVTEYLRLGHGDAVTFNGDAEPILLSAATTVITQRMGPNPATGVMNVPISNQVTIQLTGPIQRFHAAGSPLSNAILGNPGPQAVKPTLTSLKLRNLVPYFTRLYP